MSKESENTKTITIRKKKYVLKKLDAYTGSYLLFFILEKFMPAGMESQLGTEITSKLPAGRTMMTKQEFTQLQKDCLSAVSVVLPAGTFPVLNENGSWREPEMQYDTFLVMILTVQALMFNVMDFFSADGLSDLKGMFQDFSLANMPIFQHSSTPQ